MGNERWMIYGANGYTGQLLVQAAFARGLRPVLAGRSEASVRAVAERFGMEYRIFDLQADPIAIALRDVKGVLLAAGPFSVTSAPMLDACLRLGKHYLDVTAEFRVLEACYARDAEARAAGCVVMPGAAFSIVPSDCLAATLKSAMPDATHLEMAVASDSAMSRGTGLTAIEEFSNGAMIRHDHKLERVPLAYKELIAPFKNGKRRAVTVAWGDLSSAYRSTGIPNIDTYVAMPPMSAIILKGLARSACIQAAIRKLVERFATGPKEHSRAKHPTQLWARVTDGRGRGIQATLETPNGYEMSAATALECLSRVDRNLVGPGAWTPSQAFGAQFVSEFTGCSLSPPSPVV
jgi:short subunit dehydrogenase-like uncharacterized protein